MAPLSDFLAALLDVILETTESADAAVLLLAAEGQLHVGASAGLSMRGELGGPLRFDEGLAGASAEKGAPVLLHDATTDPLAGPLLSRQGLHAAYGVPLVHEQALVGVALMGSRTAYDFSMADQQFPGPARPGA